MQARVKPEAPRPLRRPLPAPDPYPVDALGPLLSAAAIAIHDLTQAPIAICAQSVLAVAAIATQGHVDVRLPIGASGHDRPASLYAITIAESGERKSACDAHALRPIITREAELVQSSRADFATYLNAKAAYDTRRQEVLKEHRKSDRAAIAYELDRVGPEPRAPLQGTLIVTEPTLEGLVKYMGVGQSSVGLVSSEGAQFVGGHAMSPEKRLATSAGLSSIWDGEPWRRSRAADGTAILPGRRLSLHLMIQPGAAMLLLGDPVLKDQGLLSRLLVAFPESTMGSRFFRRSDPASDAALLAYEDRVLAILRTPTAHADGDPGHLLPRALRMNDEAAAKWRDYVDVIEAELQGERSSIKGLANKLPEHAARIAAVLTAIDCLDAPFVTGEAMAAGIVLAEHYSREALRLFDAGADDPDLVLAEKLLKWVHDRPDDVVLLRVLYQRGPSGIRNVPTARRIVAILVDHGWLVPIDGGVEIDGKRHREAWHIVREA